MQVTVGRAGFVVADDEFVPFWRRVVAGDWEPTSFRVLDRMLTPGSTFVDVGAWIGPLTLYGATLADRCHAVEPDPRARDDLLANICRNPELATRVRVHSVAIGATAGRAQLGNITSAVGGDSMSSLLFGTAATSWPVECVTLEEFVSDINVPRPALVKIDIEGAEVEVLSGSRDYIERVHPPLLLSVHGRFWPDPLPRMMELVDILSSYRKVMTTEFRPLDPRCLLEDEALHGLFELVAV